MLAHSGGTTNGHFLPFKGERQKWRVVYSQLYVPLANNKPRAVACLAPPSPREKKKVSPPLSTCNPSHRALASPPSPSLNERPGHTQPRLLAFNLFTGSLRLSHVIDHGNGGDGGGSGGGCRPGNVSLGGAAVEIKHFNYSRLVGGASHRKRPCDKDRWKKKRACVSTCRAGGEDHERGLIHPADMNGALRAREEKASEKYETSAAGVYGGGNRSPPRAAAAAATVAAAISIP